MRTLALVVVTALAGCTPRTAPPGPTNNDEAPAVSESVSRDQLGQRVRLRGMAVDRKGGAVLVVGDTHVWLVDLASWPDGFYHGGDDGKVLTVAGILDEDHGLPVFVPREDGLAQQGIPVPAGTDLEEASRRFILRDAQW